MKIMKIKFSKQKHIFVTLFIVFVVPVSAIIWKTNSDLMPMPESLTLEASNIRKVQILDRHNIPLTVTYQNRWNIHDYISLHDIPLFLQKSFVISEDQRFYSHHGIDWIARFHALWQNFRAFGSIRGASTISEQVVRMWHPRPRTLWSRWLEGIEAKQLEEKFSKADIFEFYLNQIPYVSQRRGIVQAARFYFDRDLDTLSRVEMLALAVMVRAPSHLNLRQNSGAIIKPIHQLAGRMKKREWLDAHQVEQILKENIQIKTTELPVDASHFVQHIYQLRQPYHLSVDGRMPTTLDASLQSKVQVILDNYLKDLRINSVKNGAVLVIDHQDHEILAWVNGGRRSEKIPGSWIDAVTTPRQPGSTLKPFLYALALEKGWTAATLITDYPLAKPVGLGLHDYNNYSRIHYGLLPLRDALGNSLNIPAIRTIQFVGVEKFLKCMRQLGIRSLQQHPDYYGEGLALGNGEITLLELVQAYAVLASQGTFHRIKRLMDEEIATNSNRSVFSSEVASLIANILSDANARGLEFGHGGLLNIPVQTAIKTGTSSDYRDAWAVGFNYRYTIGIWMGNLDHTAMNGITGSRGPAMVLRSVFAELNRHDDTRPLYMSPRLVKIEICRDTGHIADQHCAGYSEWFISGTEPGQNVARHNKRKSYQLVRPSSGLQMAMDPRIPDDQEAFLFELTEIPQGAVVEWKVDDRSIATTSAPTFLWPLRRGAHIVKAQIWLDKYRPFVETEPVGFVVK